MQVLRVKIENKISKIFYDEELWTVFYRFNGFLICRSAQGCGVFLRLLTVKQKKAGRLFVVPQNIE